MLNSRYSYEELRLARLFLYSCLNLGILNVTIFKLEHKFGNILDISFYFHFP